MKNLSSTEELSIKQKSHTQNSHRESNIEYQRILNMCFLLRNFRSLFTLSILAGMCTDVCLYESIPFLFLSVTPLYVYRYSLDVQHVSIGKSFPLKFSSPILILMHCIFALMKNFVKLVGDVGRIGSLNVDKTCNMVSITKMRKTFVIAV